ncbi:hypothetical protein D3C84_795790 [compost metagenome]
MLTLLNEIDGGGFFARPGLIQAGLGGQGQVSFQVFGLLFKLVEDILHRLFDCKTNGNAYQGRRFWRRFKSAFACVGSEHTKLLNRPISPQILEVIVFDGKLVLGCAREAAGKSQGCHHQCLLHHIPS